MEDQEKTHKNPELRGDGLVRAKAADGQQRTAAGQSGNNRPARTELEGKRWNVEHHKNNNNVVIDQADQSVYIFKCEGSTIMVSSITTTTIISIN